MVAGTLSKETTGIEDNEDSEETHMNTVVIEDDEGWNGSDMYTKAFNMGENVYGKDLVKASFDTKRHAEEADKFLKEGANQPLRSFVKLGYVTPW